MLLQILSLFAAPTSVDAATFVIVDRAPVPGFEAQEPAASALADALEVLVGALIPPTTSARFLAQTGNATTASSKALFGDAQSEPQKFSVQLSASGAVSAETLDQANASGGSNSVPRRGIAALPGLSLTMPGRSLSFLPPKIGFLDRDQSLFTLNFMTLSIGPVARNVSLGMTTFGVGFQTDFKPASDGKPYLFRWTGVQLSSGLQYSHLSATFSTPFSQSTSGSGLNMSWEAQANVGAKSDIVSVPTTLTTGIRFLYLFHLYTGFGLDLNVGSTRMSGVTSGPITTLSGSTPVYTGTGVLDLAGDSKAPTFLTTRFILGSMLHLGPVKLFGQVAASNPKVGAMTLGLKVAI
ncbi:MAG: hypothetical protein JNL01_01625 [Bdellovibrionales bacterium]|nr:hypothetical protein [Bdellovibrionales bacterium]